MLSVIYIGDTIHWLRQMQFVIGTVALPLTIFQVVLNIHTNTFDVTWRQLRRTAYIQIIYDSSDIGVVSGKLIC